MSRARRGDTAARIAAYRRANPAPQRWPWLTPDTLAVILLYAAILALIVVMTIAQILHFWPVSRYQAVGIGLCSIGVVVVCACAVMALERRR